MDYAQLFERQGRLYDDLLMAAIALPGGAFAEPGPGGGPSLRDLLVRLLDEQRRHVHGTLGGRTHVPLDPKRIASPQELGPLFGGFRLTLRDAVEALAREDLAREVGVRVVGGGEQRATVDDVLAQLVLSGERLTGLAAERLRQLGAAPPVLDLIATQGHGGPPAGADPAPRDTAAEETADGTGPDPAGGAPA